jgi:hypothetical protein
MRSDRVGLDRLIRRAPIAGIFALTLLFHNSSADAGASVKVLATLPQAGGAITHHLSGDALPVGSKYRIIVSVDSGMSLAVDALSGSGTRDRLFSADRVTANRSIVLPQDGGWYAAQATSSDVRVLGTQGNVVTEHLIRTIDSSPSAGSPSLKGWAEQTKGSGQAGAGSSIEGDFDEVYERAALYRSAAIKLALAKEPIIRSGPGVTIFRSADSRGCTHKNR